LERDARWQRLREVPKRLEQFVADGAIAGAVTLVGKSDRVLALDAIGYADLAERKAMREDSLFWIASMTKPITAVAVLMLQDEGKLSVDDPVEKCLPEFCEVRIARDSTNDQQTLERPGRKITLQHLLTHTSGLGNVASARSDATLAELVAAYAKEPLRFDPGSRWEYSNAGINTLGRIVEVVSESSFPDFVQRRILRPLGMRDTTFWPSTAQVGRLARSYQPRENGSGLEEVGIPFLQGELTDRSRTPYPAGGLFSTASDLARFYQMMLGKGVWCGKRLLSEEAVAQMTRTQTGNLRTGFTPGMSFGLGFAVVKEPQGVTGMVSAGTFGHGGAYGTQSWADPQRDLILILMIQRAKLPNADGSDVRRVFQDAVLDLLRQP
jgi:CubicO group peptidase (beta-lactamase class C family)